MKENNEKKELLKIRKKYSVKYVMLYNLLDFHIISLVLIICFAFIGKFLSLFLYMLVYIAIVIVYLVICKKSASKTYITFYEDKLVYVRKFLLTNKKEEMKYEDIKEIAFVYEPGFWAKFLQERTNMINMMVYPKKGNVVFNGITIDNVYPFDKIAADVKKLIGEKISNG